MEETRFQGGSKKYVIRFVHAGMSLVIAGSPALAQTQAVSGLYFISITNCQLS
jgi:hypothetical protein